MLRSGWVALAVGLFLSAATLAASDKGSRPRFADYPAPPPYTGKVPALDFRTFPTSEQFSADLREAAKGGANYAGHMIATSWHCGTDCDIVALIDARTGKVYPGPIAYDGFSYRIGSRLLIVNPPDKVKRDFGKDPPDWVGPQYFVWHDWELTFLK